MVDPTLKKIIEAVAKEEGLTPYEVQLIFESQFQFTKEVMSKKKGESVMFRYLGKFLVEESRLSKLKSKNGRANNRGTDADNVDVHGKNKGVCSDSK